MDDPCQTPLPPDLIGGLFKVLAALFALAALSFVTAAILKML